MPWGQEGMNTPAFASGAHRGWYLLPILSQSPAMRAILPPGTISSPKAF